MKSIILLILVFLNNAFAVALQASMINPANTINYLALLALMVLTIILALVGYRKALNILGR